MEHPAYSQLRPVTPNVGVVLAPNPSYAALEGTNSWIIRGPEDKVSVVVDPGPQDEGHLNVLNTKATDDGAEIALVILTHRHADHANGAQRFRQISGAPVRAFDKQYCIAAEELEDGEVISIPGLTPTIEVVHTPGHTSDSVSLFVHSGEEGDAAADAQLEGILTGDTIAGRHTTMISETDGDLGDYLETLAKLQDRGVGIPLLPGHGPDQPDTAEVAARYIERREQRLEQVKEAMRELGDDAAVMDIVDKIYTDVDPVLRDAAAQSTRVTMRFLRGD
ncbi:MAG TPA: MBL fold metallo-hydrolase [Candidatus Corynebacterium gallistercoris]|uniref:MBL fold metallo-hydrolase n=1 Tax=Candidatus Corynebacterium gallistercoris TaxID=2838530 RepID=A0A9D1URD0_9CORY|nr:MBL fold metallo-hydrolase [Candidatus Corynebacterium gallistercoris]